VVCLYTGPGAQMPCVGWCAAVAAAAERTGLAISAIYCLELYSTDRGLPLPTCCCRCCALTPAVTGVCAALWGLHACTRQPCNAAANICGAGAAAVAGPVDAQAVTPRQHLQA
jgi:hypothetical protein